MNHWQRILAESITTIDELESHFGLGFSPALERVIQRYPMRINPYYLSLIQKVNDPLFRQAVPTLAEISPCKFPADPLNEQNLSPVANLIHRYPDRALLLVSSHCAMYCRFCTRKRMIGKGPHPITQKQLNDVTYYLKHRPEINELIISGGDPLILEDCVLEEILAQIYAITSIEVIRIGTRLPCTLPMRITSNLCKIFRRFQPLYINTHFNHPAELTEASIAACALLADHGIPLGNQTVLLKGVNDSAETITSLMRLLVKARVKPYYLFQIDITKGTRHFKTPITTGMDIIRTMTGSVSGLAIPTFAVDAPGGKGKTPLTPHATTTHSDYLEFQNWHGEPCRYPDF